MLCFFTLGRVGEPKDMAGVGKSFISFAAIYPQYSYYAALFLTSPASAHVSGANIVLDGGSLVSNRVRM
jgi:hypothetical protein